MFVHVASVGKSVHICVTRKRVSKSCLMAELCFFLSIVLCILIAFPYTHICFFSVKSRLFKNVTQEKGILLTSSRNQDLRDLKPF